MSEAYDHQDWTTVVLRKRPQGTGTNPKEVREAMRKGKGNVDTVAKVPGQSREYSDRARKLEADLTTSPTEAAPPAAPLAILESDARKAMIQARITKTMSQDQLAQAAMTQTKNIKDLESGKVIQDRSILQRVNKILGTKLRFIS
jgi:ribosome-binding protein aMBF1 (putative translation factor)